MKTPFSTLAAALLLTAGAAHAQSNAHPYRASGVEPFWGATIDSQSLRFELSGARPVVVARPRPIVGINGERYVTSRLTIDITHVPCSDGMGERRYHDTVVITTGHRSFRGCGGAITSAAPDSLLVGNWRVLSINGRSALGTSPATIRFEGERVSGNTGCNSFGGTYRFERGRLTTGPLATTRRACLAPAANGQERELLAFFGERASVSEGTRGRLVLTARSGGTMVLGPDRPI